MCRILKKTQCVLFKCKKRDFGRCKSNAQTCVQVCRKICIRTKWREKKNIKYISGVNRECDGEDRNKREGEREKREREKPDKALDLFISSVIAEILPHCTPWTARIKYLSLSPVYRRSASIHSQLLGTLTQNSIVTCWPAEGSRLCHQKH